MKPVCVTARARVFMRVWLMCVCIMCVCVCECVCVCVCGEREGGGVFKKFYLFIIISNNSCIF